MVCLPRPLPTIEAIVRLLMKALGDRDRRQRADPVADRAVARRRHLISRRRSKARPRHFGGLLDLRELQVSDVMVHGTETAMVNADLPPEELVARCWPPNTPRIPLWREKPENIIGVLHAKDLLRAFAPPRRQLEDRRLDHRAPAVVRAGDASAIGTAQSVPPPQDPFRTGGRRIRRKSKACDAGRHSGGNRRRYFRRPPPSRRAACNARIAPLEISPTISCRMSSSVTMPSTSPVFVDHQCEMGLAAAERFQLFRYGTHLRHEPRRQRDGRDVDLQPSPSAARRRAADLWHAARRWCFRASRATAGSWCIRWPAPRSPVLPAAGRH